MLKAKSPEYVQDTDLIDFHSEKAGVVFPSEAKPWVKQGGKIKRHTTSAETHLLYKLTKEMGPGNYADIGSMHGGSACTIGQGLEDAGCGHVYCVDFFGTGPGWCPGSSAAPQNIKNYFSENFTKAKVEICAGTTEHYGRLINIPFNGIFIDADHTFKSCKQDFELWSSKVIIGGWVAFHDRQFVEVQRFLRELDGNKDWKHERTVFTTEVFRRVR